MRGTVAAGELFRLFVLGGAGNESNIGPGTGCVEACKGIPFRRTFRICLSGITSFVSLGSGVAGFRGFLVTGSTGIARSGVSRDECCFCGKMGCEFDNRICPANSVASGVLNIMSLTTSPRLVGRIGFWCAVE